MKAIDPSKLQVGVLADILSSSGASSYNAYLRMLIGIINLENTITPKEVCKSLGVLQDKRHQKPVFTLFAILEENGFIIKKNDSYDISPLQDYLRPEQEEVERDSDDVLRLTPTAIRELKRLCGNEYYFAYRAANTYVSNLQKRNKNIDTTALVRLAYEERWWELSEI